MAKTGKNQKMKMLAIYTEIAANCRGKKNAITTQELVDRLNARNIACDGRVLSKEINEINEYIFRYAADGKGEFDKNSKDNVILKLIKEHRTFYYYLNVDSPYLGAGINQKMRTLAIYMEIAVYCRGIENSISVWALADMLNERNIVCDEMEITEDVDNINEYFFRCATNGKVKFNKDSEDNVIISDWWSRYYFNSESPYVNDVYFDFGELRFLCDAVSSAYFMPLNTVKQFHYKLSKKESNGRCLSSHVYLKRRYYHGNDDVLKIADELCRAIDDEEYIAFKYCNINKDGELVLCKTEKGEDERIVIPLALRFNDGFYYLHAIPFGTDKLCSFRLDKMKDVHSASVRDNENYGDRLTARQKENIAKYKDMDTLFLFMGDTWENKDCDPFSFRFTQNHIGDVLDKFGMDTKIVEEKDGWYSVSLDPKKRIRHTKELYAWLLQFGTEMQITEPHSLIKDYNNYLNSIINMYKQEEKE